jgi:DNA-binding response OmpR family regulator
VIDCHVWELILRSKDCQDLFPSSLLDKSGAKLQSARGKQEEYSVGIKILIVEDDKNLNMMLKLILKSKNLDWELHTAHSGDEAINLLKTFKPEAVVLDIMMPGMDGIELARKIRGDAKHSRVKIAALSALSDGDTKNRATAAGVDAYWTKPIIPDTLVGNIFQLLK